MKLTPRQQDFFDYLMARQEKDGRLPTLRQAAADLGVSHTAVAQLMGQLEKKGLLQRQGRYSRDITLRPQPRPGLPNRPAAGRTLPIVGEITAGLPMYAQQEWAGVVVVDETIFRGENLFCLRVKGDSMRDAGILDGDLAVCEPRQYAENGEVVAVLVRGEEATVKRFFLHPDHIELRPANDRYPVMNYPFGELLVQGKVIGIIRGNHGLLDHDRH